MNKCQIIKLVLGCLMMFSIDIAQCQEQADVNNLLILYKLNGPHGLDKKYVLCINSEYSSNKMESSIVIIGDTFSIQPSGEMCIVVMTNVDILRTKTGISSTNGVVQQTFWTDVYKIPFSGQTKLIYHNSTIELKNAKIELSDEANAKVYEGEDALDQLKRMGLKPPEDMDTNSATGQQ